MLDEWHKFFGSLFHPGSPESKAEHERGPALAPAPARLPEPACTTALAVMMHVLWALPAPGCLSAWSLVRSEPAPSTVPRLWGHFFSIKADSGPNNYSDSKPFPSHGSHCHHLGLERENFFFPIHKLSFFYFHVRLPLLFSWRLLWWDWMDLLVKSHLFFPVLVLPKFLQKYLSQRLRLVPKLIIVICHS